MTPEQTLEATFRAGNLGLARKMAVTMLQQNVKNKTALQVLAHIALLIGVTGEALPIATKALEVDNDDIRTNLLLADIHGARGHTEQALDYCDRALELNPGDFSAIQIKAKLYERSGDWNEAIQLLGPLAGVTPRTSQFTLTLSRSLMQAKEYDAAIELIDATIPDIAGETPAAKQQKSSLFGLRARIQDRAGRYDQAWTDATTANQLHDINHDPEELTQQVDQLISWFDGERFSKLAQSEHDSAQHVFIVGMPRSGTTLIEQILDAHPDITGLGEINSLDVAARSLPQTMQMKDSFPQILHFAEAKRLSKMSADYESSIEQFGFAKSSTYVNKNLRNPFLMGMIAILFPQAKVIFTNRDARDTAVSCYLSGLNPNLMPYLFDVDHIAAATENIERLNSHWQKVLPLESTIMQYETLVNDQDQETRRLVEFCGVEWNDHCLRFWESKRTVMTQSYDQVSQPMYQQSIGRYKNYEKHITPLLK